MDYILSLIQYAGVLKIVWVVHLVMFFFVVFAVINQNRLYLRPQQKYILRDEIGLHILNCSKLIKLCVLFIFFHQICRFCWHRIRTDENELCPACRKAYPENPADFTPLSQEQVTIIFFIKSQQSAQRKIEFLIRQSI